MKNERVVRIGISNKLLLRRHLRKHLRHVFFDIVFESVPFPQFCTVILAERFRLLEEKKKKITTGPTNSK